MTWKRREHLLTVSVATAFLFITACDDDSISNGVGHIDDRVDDEEEASSDAQNSAQTEADSTSLPRGIVARQDEVRKHLEQIHFNRFNVLATTIGPFGETVDWVDPRSLDPRYDERTPPTVETNIPSGEAAAAERSAVPIDPDDMEAAAEEVTLASLWQRPEFRGPEGMVPVIRPEYKYYVEGRSAAKNLKEFLSSIPVPQPADRYRLYATKTDPTVNIGTTGWVRYHNPVGVPSSGMSLAQLGVFCWGSGPGSSTLEGIEVGIQENQPLYGDSNIHFFTFFRTHGSDQGDYIGGYNLDVAGFVPRAGAFPPGATVPDPPTEGHQRRLRTVLYNDAWWVQDYVSSTSYTWLGYYPIGTGSGEINFDLIDEDACEVRWYGEVYDSTPTSWSNADMGNGEYGRNSGSAWFRNMIVERSSGGNLWFSSSAGQGGTDPACYDASALFTSSSADWRVWFRYGGPGGDASGCN